MNYSQLCLMLCVCLCDPVWAGHRPLPLPQVEQRVWPTDSGGEGRPAAAQQLRGETLLPQVHLLCQRVVSARLLQDLRSFAVPAAWRALCWPRPWTAPFPPHVAVFLSPAALQRTSPKGQSTGSYWWVPAAREPWTPTRTLSDVLLFSSPLSQRDPFIQMYEERSVDVAGYVCSILDQMPASPSSPSYMDWEQDDLPAVCLN